MEKTKHTLYNFVSLRSPQLTTTEEKEFRFIEYPEDCKADGANKNEPNDEFKKRAKYIAENKGAVDYDYLERLSKNKEIEISGETVCRIFNELVINLNNNTSFEEKEEHGTWLMLWNLKKKFEPLKIIVDQLVTDQVTKSIPHHHAPFNDNQDEKQFKNKVAKPYITQLLNATIILPTKTDKNADAILIKEKGPLGTDNIQNVVHQNFNFFPDSNLNSKHEINVANFQLAKTDPADDEKILALKTTIFNNRDFSRSQLFYAGSLYNNDKFNTVLGVKTSIFVDTAGGYFILLTANQVIGNGNTPISAKVRIKTGNYFSIEKEGKILQEIKNQWWIKVDSAEKLEAKKSLDLFIHLDYPNKISYSSSLQMTKGFDKVLFEGFATLHKCREEYFKSEIIVSDPKNVGLKLSDYKIVVNNPNYPATISIQINNYFFDKIEIKSATDFFSFDIDRINIDITKDNAKEYDVSILLILGDGTVLFSVPYTIKLVNEKIGDKNNYKWIGDSFFFCNTGSDAYGNTYTPNGFGITQLGVADYQRVVSHVIRYEAGEVAHIENLMSREYKEKSSD